MRKKLFIGALIVIVLTPLFLLGRWVYENRQVSERAKTLHAQLPKYPGATYVSNIHSIYSLGYGEQYTVNDKPRVVLDYYKKSIKLPWVLVTETGDVRNTNINSLTYKQQDLVLIVSVDSGNVFLNKASPPYNLNVDISQAQP